MLVEEEILGDTYKTLMDYLFKKCDSISLTKYHDQYEDDTNRSIDVILSSSSYSIDEIIEQYSDEFLEKIYEEFKNDEQIFNDNYIQKYESDEIGKMISYHNRWSMTSGAIAWLYYNEVTLKWVNKNKVNIINCKKNDNCLGNPNVYHSDTYTFKLNEEIKSEILSKKSLYDWSYPDSLEDICFFKDGYCFLETITHENLCFIYCDDKEEYEYLKSIGIKIFEKEFKPTKMGKWKYGDGNKQ